MTIRAITFDFWRTLFRDNEAEERRQIRVDAFCGETGAKPEAVHEALVYGEQFFLQHHIKHQITLQPRDAVNIVCERTGMVLNPDVERAMIQIFATAILDYPPVPIDGALDAVRAAAAKFPIGIISDAGLSPGSSLKQLLDRHGFTQHFRCLTFSSDMGVAKPQRKMFEGTAEKLAVDVSDLLHIGDLEFTDIVGAHAVGAKAALFAGDNTRFATTTNADYTFHHWREFVDILPKLK